MKTLLSGANVIDVFSDSYSQQDVLIEDDKIIGVGKYTFRSADKVIDMTGKFICPGFIDGHIHIESTLLSPFEFSKIAVAHGTTSVICDPHEITNVSGTAGIDYMLNASEGLPLDVFVMVPSCVPSTSFDESYEIINADKTKPYFDNPRVLGLAEMMNYVGVLYKDEDIIKRIKGAEKAGKHTDGHAPLLSGHDLDRYVAEGITTEHECSLLSEAKEKLSKGMWIIIREGTAAKNLRDLSPLIESASSFRCLFCTDDREADDLKKNGEIDNILNRLETLGISVLKGIRLATINAATCFGLKDRGAIAPGYIADMNILDSIYPLKVSSVYKNGKIVYDNGSLIPFDKPKVSEELMSKVKSSMNAAPILPEFFKVNPPADHVSTNVINIIPGQIITNKTEEILNFNVNNGIDTELDIAKIAVIERHNKTGHIGTAYVRGFGIQCGAIASTISHDSHNIIVVGTNDNDMYIAAQRLIDIGGGRCVVKDGKVIADMSLEIGGIMTDAPIDEVIEKSEKLKDALKELGINSNTSPFMHMSFISLPVIPKIKLTTFGLFDVENFKPVSLFV